MAATAEQPLTSRGPRQARIEGFDLHANVWVPPNNRPRLEQICRYLLRPPLAQDRVRLRADSRILVDLETVWRDGTAQLLFEPIEFMEKLAAIIPRPAVNLRLPRRPRLACPHALLPGGPLWPTGRRPDRDRGPRRPPPLSGCVDLARADAPRVRPRCPTPVPAVAAGYASSPSCRTRPSCGPSSPTSTTRSPLRRPVPPHRPCRARVDSPLDTIPSQGPFHARSATGALDATPFYYKVLGPTSPAPPATAEHPNRSDT